MEFHALAQLALERVAVGLQAFGQIRHRISVGVELHEAIVESPDDIELRDQGRLARIECVDDVVTGDAGAQCRSTLRVDSSVERKLGRGHRRRRNTEEVSPPKPRFEAVAAAHVTLPDKIPR